MAIGDYSSKLTLHPEIGEATQGLEMEFPVTKEKAVQFDVRGLPEGMVAKVRLHLQGPHKRMMWEIYRDFGDCVAVYGCFETPEDALFVLQQGETRKSVWGVDRVKKPNPDT